MIFKMRTELIDWIVAHGLVQGLIFGGVVIPLVDGKIVLTDEMIAEAASREGLLDSDQATVLIQQYLAANDYVSDADYVHTDNNFTDALLQKLNGIDVGAEVNKVDDVLFNGVSVLDEETKIAAITITAANIKQWYESNPDTNAFTDAEQTKLAGIAPGAEVNRVDDVLVDGRSVMDMNKKALITKEIIKAAYEANENTNAFTDDEKEGLALLVQWKPQVDQEIIEIKRKHLDDFIELQGEIKAVSDKFTASTIALHTYINQVNENLQELEQKEHDDYEELSTLNANMSAAIAELRAESRQSDEILDDKILALKTSTDNSVDGLKEAIIKESAARLANVSALQKEISNNTSQITSIKDAIGRHDEEITSLNNGLGQTNDRLTADEVLLHNTISGMTNISSQVMQLMNWKPGVDEKLSGLETEQGEVMADITKLHQDIEDEAMLREEFDNMLKEEMDSAKVNISSLMIAASSMMICCSAVKAQIETLETDVASNSSDIESIKQQLGGQGLKLLWENPNPTSSFAGTTIEFDEEYDGDFVTIVYGNTNIVNCVSGPFSGYMGKEKNVISMSLSSVIDMSELQKNKVLLSIRFATYEKQNNRVIFEGGSSAYGENGPSTWISDDSRCIPFAIYGGIGTPGAGTGGNADIQVDTLWENPDSSLAFAPQSISIPSLKDYSMIEIMYRHKTSNTDIISSLRANIQKVYIESCSTTNSFGYANIVERRVVLLESSLNFSAGFEQSANNGGSTSNPFNTTNNSVMVPQEVRGIKIVGGGSSLSGGPELLWENTDLTSEFAEQSIEINGINNYDLVLFEMARSNVETSISQTFVYAKDYLQCTGYALVGNDLKLAVRGVIVGDGATTIGSCSIISSNGAIAINDSFLIPYKIYGIARRSENPFKLSDYIIFKDCSTVVPAMTSGQTISVTVTQDMKPPEGFSVGSITILSAPEGVFATKEAPLDTNYGGFSVGAIKNTQADTFYARYMYVKA